MKGYLDSKYGATVASARRVGQSLARVAPTYNYRRQTRTERQTNPYPYVAEYYGHKLHIDQNEKLAMYGVTHVCCVDGYSRYIPAYAIMPIKNNVTIYEKIFRYLYKTSRHLNLYLTAMFIPKGMFVFIPIAR